MTADDTVFVEQQMIAALRRITRAIDLRSRNLLHRCGLTAPQLATLQIVSHEQPITASRIAGRLHLGAPTITGILDRLDRRGLIRRERAERDRRSVPIWLTEAGAEMLRAAPPLLEGHFQQRLGQLPVWEQMQMLSCLQRVADMMTADETSASDTSANGAGDARTGGGDVTEASMAIEREESKSLDT